MLRVDEIFEYIHFYGYSMYMIYSTAFNYIGLKMICIFV